MRLPMALLCCGLAACASLPEASHNPNTPPDAATITIGVRETAENAKLPAPLEVSAPRMATGMSLGPWVVCVRSTAPDHPQRYAAFFESNKYLDRRLAVIVDGCGEATYTPFTP